MKSTQGNFRVRRARHAWGCHAGLYFLALTSACAAQTKLPPPIQAAVSLRHRGRVVELRQSCFYGPLYDENEKWLLSTYPFASTSHIVDLDNKPIHPGRQLGIIPAGTKFIVDEVEFPDGWSLAKRMWTTPRYNPWVYLHPALHQPDIPSAKPFVWVMPTDLDKEDDVEQAFNKALAPEGEVSGWLATVRPTLRVAIANKEAVVGMSVRELTCAMGEPLHRYIEANNGKRADVAWFPTQEAWLVDDVVVDVKPSRAIDAANAAAAPPETQPNAPATRPADPKAPPH